jgi:ribosome-associated protein
VDWDQIIKEFKIKATPSGGPGGQHANKVSTRVEISLDISNSYGLSEEEKNRLINNKKLKLSKSNTLVIQSDKTRSQARNKEIGLTRIYELLEKALIIPKSRKKSSPSKSSVEKRLRSKKHTSDKKSKRQKPDNF